MQTIRRRKTYSMFWMVLFFLTTSTCTVNPASAQITVPEQNSLPLHIHPQSADYVDGQVIIQYKKGLLDLGSQSGTSTANAFEQSKNLQGITQIPQENIRLVATSEDVLQAVDELKQDPSVELAEPNYRRYPAVTTTNDPGFSSQWHLTKMQVPNAWDTELSADQDVVVAVIDTGVYYTHEDLAGSMWNGSGGCVDSFGAAILGGCPNHGWDFYGNDNNPIGEVWMENTTDIGPHGTWVSGVIAAQTNNSIGISGMSRFNHVKIMALRFGLDTFSELQAISFAKNNGAKIINASYGGSGFSQLEKDAIDNFGGVFVAAAGNEGANNDITATYPANYASPSIISVAATNSTDALASFSNYGATSVDLAAPGESILTTWYNSTSSYAYVGGTSFASPVVAGAAALLESKNPMLTVAQVKHDLINSGDQLPNPADAAKVLSGKRLNLYNAYQLTYKAEKPVASSPGGTYTSIQNVSLSTLTQGATIYYTTNGSTPTSSSLTYSVPITVQTSQTLKAIATAPGYTDSDTMSETYTINLPQAAAPTASLAGGTYNSNQSVTLSSATSEASIYYTTNGTTPTTGSTLYTGTITISSSQTIKAIAVKSGYADSSVFSATYTLVAVKPTASPAGGTYSSAQSVSLSTATDGATIYYTTNGSVPTVSSTPFLPGVSALIDIASTTTLKAITVKSGYTNSSVMSELYAINPTASSPIYRFWSDKKQGHFYTISSAEKDSIIANDPSWTYEGVVFSSYDALGSSLSPVYRFWSDSKQHHFYTISEDEKNSVIANDPSWAYEGIAYYAYSTQQSGSVPLYRFWSDRKQGHFYTVSEDEKNSVIANDPSWKYEGIAYYVPGN